MKRLLLVFGLLAVLVLMAHADNPHGPVVVADVLFAGQTASIGSTTLVSPSVDTGYIICYDLGMVDGFTDPQDNASVTVHVVYTDTLGNSRDFTFSGNTGDVAQGAVNGSLNYFVVKGGTTATFSAVYQAGPHNATYNLSLKMVKQ